MPRFTSIQGPLSGSQNRSDSSQVAAGSHMDEGEPHGRNSSRRDSIETSRSPVERVTPTRGGRQMRGSSKMIAERIHAYMAAVDSSPERRAGEDGVDASRSGDAANSALQQSSASPAARMHPPVRITPGIRSTPSSPVGSERHEAGSPMAATVAERQYPQEEPFMAAEKLASTSEVPVHPSLLCYTFWNKLVLYLGSHAFNLLRFPSSASVGLAGYCQLDVQGLRNISENFGAGSSAGFSKL